MRSEEAGPSTVNEMPARAIGPRASSGTAISPVAQVWPLNRPIRNSSACRFAVSSGNRTMIMRTGYGAEPGQASSSQGVVVGAPRSGG